MIEHVHMFNEVISFKIMPSFYSSDAFL